jgi:DNA mismatch repair protein MutS2
MLPAISQSMDETSAETLEFPRLLELVAESCATEPGHRWTLALAPSAERDWAAAEQRRVAEMRRLLADGRSFNFGGLFDPEALLDKAGISGAVLELEEARDMALLVERLDEFRREFQTFAAENAAEDERLPRNDALWAPAAPLLNADFSGLMASMAGKFEPDGSLASHASPELARIRRRIEAQRREIEKHLQGTLRRLDAEGALQDNSVRLRGERFVLPVKAEWKRRVPGVVHGASSSGQTFFVEPMEVIERNNDLQRLIEEEQAEVRRILAAMTRRIAVDAEAIAAGARVLAMMDSLCARARFAAAFGGIEPRFSPANSERIVLKSARHPLLEQRLRAAAREDSTAGSAEESGGVTEAIPTNFAVPLDLEMPADAPQLVISGPNTGGKTVALKTVGLLALMAQSGIPIPAESAELPLLDAVLADIGDAQSITQDLSTFSAHIHRLNGIAQRATSHSLVLLDELGSATDPDEGAALAAAVAAHFLERRAWSLISTHQTALKVYAANTPGVRNAAAGFDEAKLAPTYRIHVGAPGISAGISIAERLGLDPAVVAAARRRLGKQPEEIARFLDRLHADLLAVNTERANLESRQAEVAAERRRLEREGGEEQRRKLKELEGKLTSLIKDFEHRLREALAAVEDRAAREKASRQAERTAAKLRREFEERMRASAVAHRTRSDVAHPNAEPHIVRGIQVGDMVRLRSLGKSARVERRLDGDMFEVSAGALRMRVRRGDIAEVVSASGSDGSGTAVSPVAAARSRGIRVARVHEGAALASEINVIGRTAEEATDAVEKFLDQAFLDGMAQVRIVHGVGMGVLRKTLRQYLAGHPQVAAVREAPPSEGGAGATIVELRQ